MRLIMTREMKRTDRTLENALVNDFDPVKPEKWIDELISEIHWEEDSPTEDIDVVRNFDDESPNDSIDRDYINLMTKTFISNGGEINVIPTTFTSGLNPAGYFYKWKNSESDPIEWDVDSEYLKYHRKLHRLSPYNVFWKYSENTNDNSYIPLNA